jgi:hypothetical protein
MIKRSLSFKSLLVNIVTGSSKRVHKSDELLKDNDLLQYQFHIWKVLPLPSTAHLFPKIFIVCSKYMMTESR